MESCWNTTYYTEIKKILHNHDLAYQGLMTLMNQQTESSQIQKVTCDLFSPKAVTWSNGH